MPRSWRARLLDWLVAATAAAPRPLPRYAVAALLSALAIGLHVATRPILGDAVAFGLFLPAVVLSAAYGGLWAGLMSTALLSAAGIVQFEQPFFSAQASATGALRVFFFAVNAVIVSVLMDVLHHARRRVQRLEAQRVLQEEEQSLLAHERTRIQERALSSLSDVLHTSEVGDLLIAHGLSGLGASAGGVALFDRAGGQLVVRRSVGYPTDRLSRPPGRRRGTRCRRHCGRGARSSSDRGASSQRAIRGCRTRRRAGRP